MRVITTVLLAASATSAFVVPDEQVFAQIPVGKEREQRHGLWDRLPSLDKISHRLKKPFKHVPETLDHPLDAAIAKAAKHHCMKDKESESSPFDYSSWIAESLEQFEAGPPHGHPDEHPEPPPPHHGPPPPPHHGPPPPPHHGPPGPPHHGPPGRGPPWKRPGRKPGKRPHKRPGWRWHGHHKHGKPNMTIYELISKSNYTTNLTKLIDSDKDLVSLLNSTKSNYTIFAPTDFAFKRIVDHLPKVPKEVVKKVLLYHILPDLYPGFKLIWSHTAPTLLEEKSLGGHPQRVLAKWIGFGLKINYYDRVLAANIPATNGLIHATSAILLPPPPALGIITHLPGSFSTLELGLIKTGLLDVLNTTGKDTVGGTIFAPTNLAFKKLGPRVNTFLFSKYGEKFLKALLSYHVVPDRTLYSTAFYDGKKKSVKDFFPAAAGDMKHKCKHHDKDAHAETYVHLDLPTLLDKPIGIDIVRRGPWVVIKVNAFVTVAAQDVLARDGVIQVVNSVLIPPKKAGAAMTEAGQWSGDGEISVEELKERLAPFVKQDIIEEEMKWDL